MSTDPDPHSCGADDQAQAIYDKLVDEGDFEFPDIDLSGDDFDFPDPEDNPLYDQVSPLSLDQLTDRTVGGEGVFDAMMDVTHIHLRKEFEQQRISGREYADVYTASIQSAMSQAVSFLLGKDQAYWQAVVAQSQARRAEVEAVTARIQLENTKLEFYTLKANAKSAIADYALKKMQLSILDAEYCIKQLQIQGLEKDNTIKDYNIDHMLPSQKKLVDEQMESARGQTMNTRSDGSTIIAGMLGKQKDLYTQQITSYQRDAEVKAAKMFLDAWVTQKTLDEDLLPPTAFQMASIETVMQRVKTQNSLDV